MLTQVSEQDYNSGAFQVQVKVGDAPALLTTVTDPARGPAADANLAWYFEKHLRYPFLDSDRRAQAVAQITAYGESLFDQVFGGQAATAYRRLRGRLFEDCRLEISGSAALHKLHWEALRDPELGRPLALCMPLTRRAEGQLGRTPLPAQVGPLHLLLVVARPAGPADHGYRTISRPLLEALRSTGVSITVDLVRPGTWPALRDHLQTMTRKHGPGWYQVVHFDLHGQFSEYDQLVAGHLARKIRYSGPGPDRYEGRRGFLLFETDRQATSEPVAARQLAALLVEHGVGTAVLNACQSAMQSASEVSLAEQLAAAGVPACVGMAWSVTVSAASRCMRALYTDLANGADIAAALLAARRDMDAHRGRMGHFDQQIDLEDWLPPVLFTLPAAPASTGSGIDIGPGAGAEIPLCSGPDPGAEAGAGAGSELTGEPATEYGFIGRDLDIQAIERRLLSGPDAGQLLVHGMAGAGKSALLTHLGWWWRSTGLVDKVFRFSYEDRAWTCAQLVREIAAELQSSGEHGRADNLTDEGRMELVTSRLRARRHLLVLDNTESVTSPASSPHALSAEELANLRDLLGCLRGGATLVLIGSREPQAWPELGEASPGTYTLDGLDPGAASVLVRRILARQGAAVDLLAEAERRALEDLVTALGSYPLPMTVVLPMLAAASPSEVLAELRVGHSTADPEGLLRSALDYSHDRLPAPLRNSLELLAPFEAVIPTGDSLAYYEKLARGEEAAQAPVATAANLATAVSQAMREGLAAPHPQMQSKVQIHPSLPYFLRSRLHSRPAVLASAQSAHYELYCGIASAIRDLILSGDDPGRRSAGLTSARAEYANLTTALNYGLLRGRPVGALVYALSTFLDQTQQYEAQGQLMEGAIRASRDAPTPQPAPELAQLYLNAGDAALAPMALS